MSTVVLALDKFKGSLDAHNAVKALGVGIRDAYSECQVICCPIADGGEGTVNAAIGAGFQPLEVTVEGPLGELLLAQCAIAGDRAVVELAECCGLQYVQPIEAHHAQASTYGLGQAIVAAIARGATRVFVGLGGSASTDGGAGMLQAMGARFNDEQGQPIERGLKGLATLSSVDLRGAMSTLDGVELIALSDVENTLLGADGAAATFGPQKGLPEHQVPVADDVLRGFASQLRRISADDYATVPGSGAAGGAGFGLLSLGAKIRSGADQILRLVGLESHLHDADVVVLGEGSLDAQTLQGKGPGVVARWARAYSKAHVVAVAGRVCLTDQQLREAGIQQVYDLTERAGSIEKSMRDTAVHLVSVGHDIAKDLVSTKSASR